MRETASMLGEAWRDGTVLTTFVQLFESPGWADEPTGPETSQSESSIIIPDEPQALPKDWWGAIQRLLDIVTDEYGARVIAMTATQPTLVRDRETDSLLAAGSAHNSESCDRCHAAPDYETALPPVPKTSVLLRS